MIIEVHTLKTDPEAFRAVWEGKKTYEIRKNDRNFEIGDQLRLRETKYTGQEMANGKPLKYTDREVIAEVTHMLKGPCYGLQDGWCIMSIKTLMIV